MHLHGGHTLHQSEPGFASAVSAVHGVVILLSAVVGEKMRDMVKIIALHELPSCERLVDDWSSGACLS